MSSLPAIPLEPPLRAAVETDARAIAELIAISSDGVAVIEWTEEAQARPGLDPLDVGEATYRQAEGDYSYRNCVIAERGGQVGTHRRKLSALAIYCHYGSGNQK